MSDYRPLDLEIEDYNEDEEYSNCKKCGQVELIGNLEINEGLCNDCDNEENPY